MAAGESCLKRFHRMLSVLLSVFLARPFLPVILISALLLHLGSLDGGHNWGDDFASYIRQAECIVQGSWEPFLSQNRFTIEQSDIVPGPLAYPWGYPLLLAGVILLAGRNLLLLKLPAVLGFCGFLLGAYGLFRDRLTRIDRGFFLLFFALSPVFAAYSNDIASDTVFLCLAYWSLLAGKSCLRAETGKDQVLFSLLAGLLIGFASMVRINGAVLLPALLAALLFRFFRKRENGLYPLAGVMLGFCPVILLFLVVFPSGESSHLSLLLNHLSGAAQWSHFRFYAYEIWIHWFHVNYRIPVEICAGFWAAGLIFLSAGLYFTWKRWWEETIFYGCFAAGTGIVYWLWPAMELRFFYPLLPLLLFWILRGVRSLTARQHFRCFRPGIRVIILLLIASGLTLSVFRSVRLHWQGNPLTCAAYTPSSLRLYEYIRRNTPGDAVILFFKPRVLSMQTGRRSLYIVKKEHLDKGSYYCHTADMQDRSGALMQAENLQECYRDGPFRLFRIRKWNRPDRKEKSD